MAKSLAAVGDLIVGFPGSGDELFDVVEGDGLDDALLGFGAVDFLEEIGFDEVLFLEPFPEGGEGAVVVLESLVADGLGGEEFLDVFDGDIGDGEIFGEVLLEFPERVEIVVDGVLAEMLGVEVHAVAGEGLGEFAIHYP